MSTEDRRNLIVDNPIINDPFQEPTRYWLYTEGQPQLKPGRRPAGYYLAARTTTKIKPLAEEEFVEIEHVNQIRDRIRKWRQGYPGTTRVTRELLRHWNDVEREGRKRLFFCEKEAAETVIWLTEASPAAKQGITFPPDEPNDPVSIEKNYKALRRYCCKMATGSGKTVVMAMLIAWSAINKLQNKQDRRFTDAFLVVCPNLTIKERLQVLQPSNPKNYYEEFDLVPRSLLSMLAKARIVVTNWQSFNPQDDSRTRSVMQRGEESDSAFCRRVLSDLVGKKNILVINDEAHHAYRPKQKEQEELGQTQFTKQGTVEQEEIEEEYEEATVWINALDRINATLGINFCIDMSATPFYIKGSGYQEGKPHPWMVSDFGLVDAIESGIVKIPRVPVDSNSGRYIPEYFELWKWINEKLPYADRQTVRRRAKPEAVYREGGQGALAMLSGEWEKTFEHFQKNGAKIPPVMIVVCDNTNLSELVTRHIAVGDILPELGNTDDKENTLRIDTKLLEEAESKTQADKPKKDKAELLRRKVSTVGKEGELGEQIRCVVSVGMLNEGWDAQNVTQILGLRAFTSQLLCEQVVGRGLRRTNYDDFTHPEYVDVYGIPFEVIPVAKKTQTVTEQERLSTLVRALPERKNLEIKFPRVEGYVFDVKQKITADVDSMPRLIIDPAREPTEVIAKDFVGYRIGRPDRLGPGQEVIQDRNPFHSFHRLQTTVYQIAAEITDRLGPEKRPFIFPQVLEITWWYIEKRVKVKPEAKIEEIALRKYMDWIISRLSDAIRPDTDAGETPILPIIERYRQTGSSGEVMFRTVKECYGTRKSHVSHVVTDSRWEHSVAYQLERNPNVIAYVKNDHLDFEIPYEFSGIMHGYRPDYIIHYKQKDGKELNVILEVKGYEGEQDRAKQNAAKKWVDAVNYNGGFGKWKLTLCRDPHRLNSILDALG